MVAGLAMAALFLAAPAEAAIPPSLTAGCTTDTTAPESYTFCDDGVPNAGGLVPNVGGLSAVTVPAKYGSDGFTGLPPQAADAATVPGADPGTGKVALDVDVSYPASGAGPFPLLVFMHGCCSGDKTSWESNGTAGTRFDAGGELWHYSNAWFASRGYVVINYTARGFVNGQNNGSTGQTQLDSRNYEVNDYQDLSCQVTQLFNGNPTLPDIDPSKVVPTGGSYGGGFSWLALTDPKWNCATEGAAGVNMGLAAAAPRYGWTDLVYSLVPTGTHFGEPGNLPAFNGCDSGPVQVNGSACPAPQTPYGLPKKSILNVLYASGTVGLPPGFSHTTFAPDVTQAFTCLSGPEAGLASPSCAQIPAILVEFLRDRSAYYQNDFFAHLTAADPGYTVPTFDAATLTDPLFPASENRRMINRLRAVDPNYPVQAYYGDYQHFVQNKAKVWADTCGADHHRCSNADYPGATPADFSAAPATRVRQGVTSRLNAFIDHYAHLASGGPPDPGSPSFDVTAELEVCQASGPGADEGGEQFTAPTFEQLAPNTLTINNSGAQTTTNDVSPNPHAANDDPLINFVLNGGRCPVDNNQPGPGVAQYTSAPLPQAFTMIGGTTVTVNFTATGPVGQMDSRLYDVAPDGTTLMVDRGPRRLSPEELSQGSVTYQLHGNGWRFAAGHRVKIELAQDDDPFVHLSETPSTATLTGATLQIPVREQSATIGGGPSIGKISARGTVGTAQGPAIAFSAANDCNPTLSTRPSTVGTTAGGRIWTKTNVTASSCTDQLPPSPLGFDTQTGTASGTFGPSAPGGRNGQQGTLQWTYRDSPDTVQFTLRDSSNTVVFQANQQTPSSYSGSPGGVWTFAP